MSDVAPRRARLELLVRHDDEGEGFELRQIGSGVAFIQSRPQRLADYELTDDERATVLAALARLGQGSAGQRAAALRTALIRRVAT